MKDYLNVQEVRFSNKIAFLMVLIAYVFAIVVRLYYYNWASGIKEFIWHGTLMINNVDGYFYAAGAKELLNHSHVVGDLNPYHSFPSILTAAVVKLFPFLTLDQVILWMPAVFGSLLVVPLFLIGRSLKNDILGFAAALMGGIVWSYYNRTMIGYYDTDMLVIVLLVFVIWGIIDFFVNDNNKMLLITPFIILIYELWYPQCRTVLLGTIFFSYIYTLLYNRTVKSFVFLSILLLSLLKIPFNIILVVVIYFLYIKYQDYIEKKFNIKLDIKNLVLFSLGLFIIALIIAFYTGILDVLISKVNSYFFRGAHSSNTALHFYSAIKTVREASQISYTVVAHRVSGNWILFILSGIGYLLMLVRFPVILVSLPLVVIGVMAHKLGLRFTIYAVPFFALGFAYLAVLLGEKMSKVFINDKVAETARIVLPLILIIPSLYVNVQHVMKYKTPTTFIKQEVASLDKLSHIAKPEDYVLTWWDYGYPIRYYAGVKTLIDGGKGGHLNFPVSFALTHDQTAAANIARLDVEYTDKVEVAHEVGKKIKTKGFIEDMMEKYGFKDPNDFLNALNNPDFKLPEKTRDVYFYFPFRLTGIYPTVAIFSAIDLKTGKINRHFILPTQVVAANREMVKFANGLWLDMRGNLHAGGKIIPVNSFYLSYYDKKGEFKVLKNSFNPASDIYVVWYKPLNKVLIVDGAIFNSTYVQMFFLQNYDKNLFEPVILNPFVKIYKLKK